jgi:hypothetical protein
MVDDTDHCTRFITVFNSLEAGVFRKFTSIADTPEKTSQKKPYISIELFSFLIAINMD